MRLIKYLGITICLLSCERSIALDLISRETNSCESANTYLDVSMSQKDKRYIRYEINEKQEFHKEYDAFLKYPIEYSENGLAIKYTEQGIGYAMTITDFTCDKEYAQFDFNIENVDIYGWDEINRPELRHPIRLLKINVIKYDGPVRCKIGKWIDLTKEILPAKNNIAGAETMMIRIWKENSMESGEGVEKGSPIRGSGQTQKVPMKAPDQ